MDFEIPREIRDQLRELDAFIDPRVARILLTFGRRPKGAPEPQPTRVAD
jgi:hypothetical protein